MYKILRIICCVIGAALLAACVFVFVYAGMVWGVACVVGAGACFALTILFKSLQEDAEKKHILNSAHAEEKTETENGKEIEAEQPTEEE